MDAGAVGEMADEFNARVFRSGEGGDDAGAVRQLGEGRFGVGFDLI